MELNDNYEYHYIVDFRSNDSQQISIQRKTFSVNAICGEQQNKHEKSTEKSLEQQKAQVTSIRKESFNNKKKTVPTFYFIFLKKLTLSYLIIIKCDLR